MSEAANFSSIPILDFSLTSSPTTKPKFINDLRHALINVGFLYLSNHGVEEKVKNLEPFIPRLFDLPQEAKDSISMINSPHFLGYSKLGNEITKGAVDWREQFDIATPHKCRWKDESDPEWLRLWGPSQWPPEELLPNFRETFEAYLDAVQALSYTFAALVSEALGLGPDGLRRFYSSKDDGSRGPYGNEEEMQHRAKVVKYPIPPGSGQGQGVGPHYDAGFLTFLLQASDHRGLQVQNISGKWIDAAPVPGTFVVNIGKALEFVTGGIARATSHRVLSPQAPEGGEGTPRYSVPFFQNIRMDVKLAEEVLEFPPEILKLRDERGIVSATDSVNFTEFNKEPSGKVGLIGRIKSHPDVGERHYPDSFKQIFPSGFQGKGSAY